MTGNALKLRLALFVASDTPAHLQRCNLLHNVHLLDFTMTLLALNASTAVSLILHVNLVRKVDVIRKVMHFDPLNWIIVIIMLSNFLNIGIISSHQTVTHARVQRRNAR